MIYVQKNERKTNMIYSNKQQSLYYRLMTWDQHTECCKIIQVYGWQTLSQSGTAVLQLNIWTYIKVSWKGLNNLKIENENGACVKETLVY